MKLYTLDSVLSFGKYENSTLEEVFEIDPSYIEWCILNLDHFFIDFQTIKELTIVNIYFDFPESTLDFLRTKILDEIKREEDEERRRDYLRDSFYALTDGQLGDYDEYGGDMDDAMDYFGH